VDLDGAHSAPAAAKNVVLRSDGEVLSGPVISELGVFGTYCGGITARYCTMSTGGWLLRTKAKDQ
jgi:glutathione synthase